VHRHRAARWLPDDRLDALQAQVIRLPSSSQLTELGGYRITDSYRDPIVGTAGAYTSVVSNQQNAVMKQLAVIFTIFLR
jgi:hypothetical protein